MILVVNKVDRPDARIAEVVARGRGPVPRPRRRRGPARLPDRLHERARRLGVARAGRAGREPAPAARPARRARARAHATTAGHPLQAHVTNLDASPYLGRLAICRVRNGVLRRGEDIAWCRADGETVTRARVSELLVTEALDRVPTDEAGPGRDRRGRRPRRRDARRDARRPRRPAGAAGDPRRRAVAGRDDRRQLVAAGRTRGRQAHRAPAARPPRRRARSATSRCASPTPSAPTPGRSRAAASSSSRCSSSSCAARASR